MCVQSLLQFGLLSTPATGIVLDEAIILHFEMLRVPLPLLLSCPHLGAGQGLLE